MVFFIYCIGYEVRRHITIDCHKVLQAWITIAYRCRYILYMFKKCATLVAKRLFFIFYFMKKKIIFCKHFYIFLYVSSKYLVSINRVQLHWTTKGVNTIYAHVILYTFARFFAICCEKLIWFAIFICFPKKIEGVKRENVPKWMQKMHLLFKYFLLLIFFCQGYFWILHILQNEIIIRNAFFKNSRRLKTYLKKYMYIYKK